jgi:hypothetical protein
MIVNYTEAGWQIITQRSHGLLAAQICARWKKENQPERWLETLIATAEHDDVYNEFENDDLLNENGGPVNYTMSVFRRSYSEKLLNMAVTKSRYVALLIARHINFVHGEDPAGKIFCAELKKNEQRWLQEAKTTSAEVAASYELLEFCDALSLLICQGMIQPEQRKIEISNGPDGKPYSLYSGLHDELIVADWPFEVPEFRVNFESRLVKQLSFSNVKAFRTAVFASEVQLHEIIFRKK